MHDGSTVQKRYKPFIRASFRRFGLQGATATAKAATLSNQRSHSGLSLDGKLMSVDVRRGASLETSAPKVLFHLPQFAAPPYPVTADGQRLILVQFVEEGSESF
jgi:hypothetical protein